MCKHLDHAQAEQSYKYDLETQYRYIDHANRQGISRFLENRP